MAETYTETLDKLTSKLKNSTDGFTPRDGFQDGICEQYCEKHGAFKQFVRTWSIPYVGIKTIKTDCPDCVCDEINALRTIERDRESQAKARKIESLKSYANIPKRFAESSFDNYEESVANSKAKRLCKAYADKWLDRKAKGGGLVLCGKPGTGKNHLACAIANQVIEEHQDEVLLTTALRIARKVKATWAKDSTESEWEAMAVYVEPELLVIDEIGVQFGSEAEKIILFEIINTRYEEMKPTILISNLSQEELGAYIGDRIIDRMREGGGVMIAFDWESHRK